MKPFTISPLLSGRPECVKPHEKDCYDLLDRLGISYQRVELSYFPQEEENLQKLKEILGTGSIKNLVFHTMRRSPDYYYILTDGDTRFDTHWFRDTYHVTKIELVTEEELHDLLHTTPGCVSILELLYDPDCRLNVYIDESLLKRESFRCHPNDNHTVLKLRTQDVTEKIMPSFPHTFHFIKKG